MLPSNKGPFHTDGQLEQWMRLALSAALVAGAQDEVPIGAVLVSSAGEVLADGCNERERSARTLAHAELCALERYNQKNRTWRLPPQTALFVTVEPCLMCTGALLSARLSAVYFGCCDPKNAGLSRLQPWIEQGVFDHRLTAVRGKVLEVECQQLLGNYFKKKRNQS